MDIIAYMFSGLVEKITSIIVVIIALVIGAYLLLNIGVFGPPFLIGALAVYVIRKKVIKYKRHIHYIRHPESDPVVGYRYV